MPRTIISADSPADLDRKLCVKYGIETIPLHIILDNESFDDGVNITPQDIYNFYRQRKILPKTSAISVAEYSDFFETLSVNGDRIVHLSLSASLSSSHYNAVIAAEDFPNVYVVDTKSVSSGLALLAIKASLMSKDGKDADFIADEITFARDKVKTSFIVDKLEFLSKGGRCSSAAALGANLLSIKPSIVTHDGKLSVGKKYRGRLLNCQIQYVRDILNENKDRIDRSRVFIDRTVGFPEDCIAKLKKEVGSIVKFDEYIDAFAGCTISAHCGENVFGLMFMLN